MPATSSVPPAITSRFDDALAYARCLHAEQPRKGTAIPYLAHLLAVAALVLEDGGDEDQAIAALLHDAVEDKGGRPTLEEIRRLFGERVARIVEACTDSLDHDALPWEMRKQEYLEHLRRAPPEVLRVSAADKLHNARAILADYRALGDSLWSRFSTGKEEILWYYRSLAVLFRERYPGPLADKLGRVVAELECAEGGFSMMADETGIHIGPEDDTIAFLILFSNGLQSYVLARASACIGYSSSTLLLSQQAVELLIKAIRRLENEKPEVTHNLVKLIDGAKKPIPQTVKNLIVDDATRQFLQALSDAYYEPRYAETRLDVHLGKLLQHLDRVVSVLAQAYSEKIKYPKKPKLYVPDWMREAVLEGNSYFGPDDLTTNPLALMMPGAFE